MLDSYVLFLPRHGAAHLRKIQYQERNNFQNFYRQTFAIQEQRIYRPETVT